MNPLTGERITVKRSAREVIAELEHDSKAAEVIRGCLGGGE